jgi:hypothetical protein
VKSNDRHSSGSLIFVLGLLHLYRWYRKWKGLKSGPRQKRS